MNKGHADLMEWLDGDGSLVELCIIFPVVLWAMPFFGPTHRDRVFFASWGSAMVSSSLFGGVLLDDAAYDALAALESGVEALAAVFAARPLLLPSALALVSAFGFAWSAYLYSRERGDA